MICKQCKDSYRKSHVYVGATTSTLIAFRPFYDEDGNYHQYDPNIKTTSYECSNGHRWEEKQ